MTKRKYNIQKLRRIVPEQKQEVWPVGTKVRLTRDITLFKRDQAGQHMLGFHAGEKGLVASYEGSHVFLFPPKAGVPIAYIVQLEGFDEPTLFPLEYLERITE